MCVLGHCSSSAWRTEREASISSELVVISFKTHRVDGVSISFLNELHAPRFSRPTDGRTDKTRDPVGGRLTMIWSDQVQLLSAGSHNSYNIDLARFFPGLYFDDVCGLPFIDDAKWVTGAGGGRKQSIVSSVASSRLWFYGSSPIAIRIRVCFFERRRGKEGSVITTANWKREYHAQTTLPPSFSFFLFFFPCFLSSPSVGHIIDSHATLRLSCSQLPGPIEADFASK